MTDNVSYEDMEPFENPNLLPLENLRLEIKTDGVVQYVTALNKIWASDRYILHYVSPDIYDDKGCEILGAKNRWTEIVNYMIDDLRWLLSRPFYRFWSNIVYNNSILDSVVSFLQEAPPFYALENFPNCPEMRALLEKLRRYVLMLFTRLITNKQNDAQYMTKSFLGELLYSKYIFTVPIIFDLCQLYGRENQKVVSKILDCLFTLAPQYNDDLERTVPCLIEALENVEVKFASGTTYNNATVSLSNRNTSSAKFTLFNLEDMILYILDIISTVAVFLKNYYHAVSIFHKEDFINKILAIYENTIPEMYKTLDKLTCNDENMPKYMELKHRLDVTRIEILHLFRTLIYEPIICIQESINAIAEAEIKKEVDEYLHLLNNAISEKEFITDYVRLHPVEKDLDALSNICPEVDAVDLTYMLQSINATIGKPCASSTNFATTVNGDVAGPSGISNRTTASNDTNSSNKKQTPLKDSVNLPCLISEIKDILHDLDEQFIKRCLEYYHYNTADVIHAVLEDSLPPVLKELKDMPLKMPSPPPSYQGDIDYEDLIRDVRALNIPDNCNNVRVKTHEDIEVPKSYILKNFSLVNEYEDEYDDTYDTSDSRAIVQDDATEVGSRPFTTPRVLDRKQKVETVNESESEDEDVETEQNGKHFIRNPEEIRAEAEQRRQATQGRRSTANMIGKSNGKGQENNVSHKKQQKSRQKHHNQRSGAAWKQRNGMVPS